jgi:hypothetical protein
VSSKWSISCISSLRGCGLSLWGCGFGEWNILSSVGLATAHPRTDSKLYCEMSTSWFVHLSLSRSFSVALDLGSGCSNHRNTFMRPVIEQTTKLIPCVILQWLWIMWRLQTKQWRLKLWKTVQHLKNYTSVCCAVECPLRHLRLWTRLLTKNLC